MAVVAGNAFIKNLKKSKSSKSLFVGFLGDWNQVCSIRNQMNVNMSMCDVVWCCSPWQPYFRLWHGVGCWFQHWHNRYRKEGARQQWCRSCLYVTSLMHWRILYGPMQQWVSYTCVWPWCPWWRAKLYCQVEIGDCHPGVGQQTHFIPGPLALDIGECCTTCPLPENLWGLRSMGTMVVGTWGHTGKEWAGWPNVLGNFVHTQPMGGNESKPLDCLCRMASRTC